MLLLVLSHFGTLFLLEMLEALEKDFKGCLLFDPDYGNLK